jgi:hypothetical protein
MAYPPLRSMNNSLVEGATDGKYKKLRPNTDGGMMNQEATNTTRRSLSLLYYGIGEARMNEVPGRNTYVPNPSFTPNKFETLEDSSVLGESW